MKKSLLSTLALAASMFAINASAATYAYEDTLDPDKYMDSYFTSWNEDTETLKIKSSWSGIALSRIEFLISDGPWPWGTSTHGDDPHDHGDEQFLFYSIDLAAQQLDVKTYKGNQATIEVFDNTQGVSVTANSIDLSIDHTSLNALTIADLNRINRENTYSSYRGTAFTDRVGIWYYMYDMSGKRIETYDIHNAGTSVVPIPAALFLFAPALAGFAAMRRKLTPANS